MKIAIIGTGISGLVCAHLLHEDHELTIFEANDYVGGHTHTVDVVQDESPHAVDTGFIVFNDWTYPNFIKLLKRLGVETQPTTMSFSVKNERSGLEYNGTSLDTLFAQRRNLLSPGFIGMIRDILRFNRRAPQALQNGAADRYSLGEYLHREGYGTFFIRNYIVPMGSAIWSAPHDVMLGMPLRFFVQFFKNHGMLSVNERPQWHVIRGGSREYVRKLIKPFEHRIRLNSPVHRLLRHPSHVEVQVNGSPAERFDEVIIATHSDQALRMLGDPTVEECLTLSAIRYQRNDVLLHTDERILPRRRKAWAAWNYLARAEGEESHDNIALTYDMNLLQSLTSRRHFCVTLNRSDAIDEREKLREFVYEHPVFNAEAVAAQRNQETINGVCRTYFCGAYWGYGFHEDGVNSALAVTRIFGKTL